MCGIYVTNIENSIGKIKQKLKSIQFRGPDSCKIEQINDVSLGHLRLSILDLDHRADQPMGHGNLHIVFNGEIYNFKEIRAQLIERGWSFKTESDTEVLLLGYRCWGKNILNKINGMFAFCIYDSLNNKLFCARDRLGVKPFYYYWYNGKIEICSQLRPLIHSKRKISDYAVSIYLDCGYIPSPYSIIENVHKLPPGNFLEIDLNNSILSIEEYWNLKKVDALDLSYEDAKNRVHELLIDSVKIRLQADVPIGTFLSGGIDSALVSSIASNVSNDPINTFSIGFTDMKYDESYVAGEYAKILKTNHTLNFCRPSDVINLIPQLVHVYDEPFADSSALPSLLLNAAAKKNVTVALSGDGGDESFLGYRHFSLMNDFSKIEKFPFKFRKLLSLFPWYLIFGGRPETITSFLNSKNADEFAIKIFTGTNSLQKMRDMDWLKEYNDFKWLSNNSIQKLADLNIKLWLENDSNVKVDRASMASSLEVRSPFLDYRIIEFARQLPVSYRFQKNCQKKILRDILKEYIPEDLFNQPKKGFSVPMGRWIREDLKNDFLHELNDEFLNSIPNLNVSKFKNLYSLHLNKGRDYSTLIWRLFILSKWLKEFEFM